MKLRRYRAQRARDTHHTPDRVVLDQWVDYPLARFWTASGALRAARKYWRGAPAIFRVVKDTPYRSVVVCELRIFSENKSEQPTNTTHEMPGPYRGDETGEYTYDPYWLCDRKVGPGTGHEGSWERA